jgi:hypothetical protein
VDDPKPAIPPARRPRSNRGAWTITAIFGLGFAVLSGLYFSPRGYAPAVPGGLVEGWPDKSLTFVVVDGGPIGPRPELLAEAVAKAAGSGELPDVALIVDVEASMVPPVAEALRMQGSFHPQLYQRVRKDRQAGGPPPGVCVLSRHPLYAGRAVRDGDRTVGVTAVGAVDGRRFSVTCLDVRGLPAAASRASASPLGAAVGVVAGAADDGLFMFQVPGPPETPGSPDDAPAIVAAAGTRPGGSQVPGSYLLDVVARSAAPPTLVFTVRPATHPATRPAPAPAPSTR